MTTPASEQSTVKFAAIARSAFIDGSILAGGGLLSYGAWMLAPAAGYIVGGALLMASGIAGARVR